MLQHAHGYVRTFILHCFIYFLLSTCRKATHSEFKATKISPNATSACGLANSNSHLPGKRTGYPVRCMKLPPSPPASSCTCAEIAQAMLHMWVHVGKPSLLRGCMDSPAVKIHSVNSGILCISSHAAAAYAHVDVMLCCLLHYFDYFNTRRPTYYVVRAYVQLE